MSEKFNINWRMTKTKSSGTMPKSKKKGRVIIRNLSFKVTEDVLRDVFLKFGEISEIIIPKKTDGKMYGFGFIQFVKTASAIKAINALNAKEILGRPVAIDFAIPKDKFTELKMQTFHAEQKESKNLEKNDSCSESDGSGEEEQSFNKKRKHSESNSQSNNESSSGSKGESDLDESDEIDGKSLEKKVKYSDSSSSGKSDNDSDEESEDDRLGDEVKHSCNDTDESYNRNEAPSNKMKKTKLARLNDVNEGRTLFIRNLSFDTTAEELKEAISVYGDTKYCLLCKDPLTEYPKGTAFVQFVNKEDAEKCLKESSRDDNVKIILGGRPLNVALALSHDDIKKQNEAKMKKGKDNRNLKLETEGLIKPGSEAAQGISQADLAKRLALEKYKKRLLKNLNYFISPVRLCVHNIPLRFDDAKLRKIFLKAAGPGAVITECRIMRNLKKFDEKGIGLSKGFGFVTFTKHEHALQALRKLNNNPETFSLHKRPIVEFSVENRSVLNAKKRQIERQKEKHSLQNSSYFKDADNTRMEDDKQKFPSKKKKFSKSFKPRKSGKQQSNIVKKSEEKNIKKRDKRSSKDGKKWKKLKDSCGVQSYTNFINPALMKNL